MILDWDWKRKQILLEEIKRLNLEYAEARNKLDVVLEQIRDQRNGNVEVQTNTYNKKAELKSIESILENTARELEKSRQFFYKLTDNQKEKIALLNQDINKKVEELSEYSKIKLIDKEAENKRIKNLIKEKIKEVEELELKKVSLKKEIDEFEKYRTKESQKLDKQKKYQETVKSALAKRTKDLNRKEKRLNKLHLEIKWNKNG